MIFKKTGLERLMERKYFGFHTLGYLRNLRFNSTIKYLDESSKLIKQLDNDLIKDCKEWDKKFEGIEETEEHIIPSGYDQYEGKISINSQLFTILTNSIVLTIYSIFEAEFHTICKYCGEEEKLIIPESTHIDPSYNFIKKSLDIDISHLSYEWENIKCIQIVRNCLAHNNGILNDSEKNILTKKFIEETDGIKLDDDLKIKITSIEFLKRTISKLDEFLSSIEKEIYSQKCI